MKRLTRERFGYAFDGRLEPELTVEPGESFWVETNDAHKGTIVDETVVFGSLEDVLERLGGANPVSGPVAVTGAGRGDCLLVRIEEIVPAPGRGTGYTCTTPAVDARLEPETVMCPIEGSTVLLPTRLGQVRLPLRPMIGTLGVAPPEGERPSFGQGRDFLGNVDLPAITVGATVVLPVHVDGGLVFLGDAHLAQGDAEIHRASVEAEADVRLRIDVLSRAEGGFAGLPQVNTADAWGSVATGPGHLEEIVRDGFADLAARLVGAGLALADAWRLLGFAGRVAVGQVLPQLQSVLVQLPTAALPASARRSVTGAQSAAWAAS